MRPNSKPLQSRPSKALSSTASPTSPYETRQSPLFDKVNKPLVPSQRVRKPEDQSLRLGKLRTQTKRSKDEERKEQSPVLVLHKGPRQGLPKDFNLTNQARKFAALSWLPPAVNKDDKKSAGTYARNSVQKRPTEALVEKLPKLKTSCNRLQQKFALRSTTKQAGEPVKASFPAANEKSCTNERKHPEGAMTMVKKKVATRVNPPTKTKEKKSESAKKSESQIRNPASDILAEIATKPEEPLCALGVEKPIAVINSVPEEVWSEGSSEKQTEEEPKRRTTPTSFGMGHISRPTSSDSSNELIRTRSSKNRSAGTRESAVIDPERPMTPKELWEKIESFSNWLAGTLKLDGNGNPISRKSSHVKHRNSNTSSSTESLRSQVSRSSSQATLGQSASFARLRSPLPKYAHAAKSTLDPFQEVRRSICTKFHGERKPLTLEEIRRKHPRIAALPCFKDVSYFADIVVPQVSLAPFTGLTTTNGIKSRKELVMYPATNPTPPIANSNSIQELRTAFTRSFQLPKWAKECFSDDGSDRLKDVSDDEDSSTISAISLGSVHADSKNSQSQEVVSKIFSLYANVKSSFVEEADCSERRPESSENKKELPESQ